MSGIHHHHYPNPNDYQATDNQKLIRLCTVFSVTIATILTILKFLAWYVTGSVTMLSSLMDSSMDLLVAAVNFVAIRYSFKPADSDHRFGHARAQDLAALAQASFITYLSIIIAIEAVKRFIHPVAITSSNIGITIIVISLVLTILLVGYQRYVFRKTASTLIHADAAHYLTDVLSNISVIIVLVISTYSSIEWLDPALGLLLAAYVCYNGFSVGIRAFHNLMDKEMPNATREEIIAIILSHSKVRNISELKTRTSGHKSFIQFDFMMDGAETLNEAHNVAHELEAKLVAKFPDAEVFIHQEPA